MKKVIKGARYDTSAAKCLGEASANCSYSDFGYWEQHLYRTRAGRYFLHKEGFGYPCGDESLGWGEEICPINEESARQWAKRHLNADEYEAIFGPTTEDARITVDLPEALLEKLDARKGAERKSRSEIVIAALKSYL